ncbi:MAG TPA: hypothetical protein VG291_09835 [Xanthobacteraceae bacterium]|jgi:hypothetical protein|nr:hypothetical protein [Xanthobacteraceae bacterium]
MNLSDHLVLVVFLFWAALIAGAIFVAVIFAVPVERAKPARAPAAAKPYLTKAEYQKLMIIMSRLNDPRLLVIVGIGIAALGLIFSECRSFGRLYGRDRIFCSQGMDDLQLFGIPYAWLLGVSVCLVLYSAYRFLKENRKEGK